MAGMTHVAAMSSVVLVLMLKHEGGDLYHAKGTEQQADDKRLTTPP
jgi:hypothetical protein